MMKLSTHLPEWCVVARGRQGSRETGLGRRRLRGQVLAWVLVFAGWFLATTSALWAAGIPNSGRLLSLSATNSITVGEPLVITATVENTTQPFLGTYPEPWYYYGTYPSWVARIEIECWESTPKVYTYYNYDMVFWGGVSDSLEFTLSETNLPAAPGYYAVLVNTLHPYDSDFAYIYYVRMTDSPELLYFSIVNGPVAIWEQPQSQAVLPGSNVLFSVKASGTADMDYQWRFNEKNLPGANSPGLLLTNVSTNHAGHYSVRISNAFNSVTSQVATLTVIEPPVIVGQPARQRVLPGSAFLFRAVVAGTPPLSYQWSRNGTPLDGQTNSTLTLANAARADAGSYSVTVSNAAGVAPSSNALLRVLVPQRLLCLRSSPGGRLQIFSSDADGGLLSPDDLPYFELQGSTHPGQWSALPNLFLLTNGWLLTEEVPPAARPHRFYRIMER